MCVVFDNTPILDQILAIYLHCLVGEEDEIVRKSNVYNLSDEFYTHRINEDIVRRSEPPISYVLEEIDDIDSLAVDMFIEKEKTDGISSKVKKLVKENLLENIFDVSKKKLEFLLNPPFKYDMVLDNMVSNDRMKQNLIGV